MARQNLYGEGLTSDDLARNSLEVRKKTEPRPERDDLAAQYWREIERYRRATSPWQEDGVNIEKLYFEEDRTSSVNTSAPRRLALLWANVETLKPAVYVKPPVVLCSRRYKDRDPIARIAAELMERATNTMFDLYNVDETFKMVRDDRLLPGRGQAWVRYEATIERYPDDAKPVEGEAEPDPNAEPAMRERVASERACTDYVHWTDFGHNVSGAWNEVWLVWRCVYKTQDECVERFGKEKAAQLTYDAKAPASSSDSSDASGHGEAAEDFCKIYELWDKRRNKVSWLTEGMKSQFLDTGKPPIDFTSFFPCPMPCYATKLSKSLIPRPDYSYYRDQAKEINDLTDKIHGMMQWLVVKAFVPGAPSRVSDAIEEMIREKSNRELFVTVESFTEWTERGGVNKLIDWLPLDMIIKAIQAAIQARDQLIQDVFQITGLSDILRGQTDPSETLGAQELKAQTGSRRLKNAKDEVARFCKDIARLNAEVVAEKFSPETIAELTGYRYVPMQPPQPGVQAIGANGGPPMNGNVLPFMPQPQGQPGLPVPMPQQPGGTMPVPAAPMGSQGAPDEMGAGNGPNMTFDDRVIKLLRDGRLREFRIDVETDSTGQADEQADKQQATEFLGAVGPYIEKAVNAIQLAPEMSAAVGGMLLAAVRRYRFGRQLEEDIEQGFEKLSAKAQAAAGQPQQSPEQIKAQAAAEALKQKMEADAQVHQQAMDAAQQKLQADLALSAEKMRQTQLELEQSVQEHNMRMAEMAMESDAKAQERAQDQLARQAESAEKAEERRGERELVQLTRHLDLVGQDRAAQRDEEKHTRETDGALSLATAKGQDKAKAETSKAQSSEASNKFLGELAKSVSETQAMIAKMVAAASAPRHVTLERGPDGKATGATSAPVGGAQGGAA